KSIEEEAPKVPKRAAQAPSPFGVVEFFQLLKQIPAWAWILMGGCAAVAVVSLAADLVMPDESFERALWEAIQVISGLLAILVGRIWAIILVTSEEASIGIMDVFFSWKLWKLTIQRLPLTRKPVWMGAWGATAVACAYLIVGGHEYWYQYYNPPKYAKK